MSQCLQFEIDPLKVSEDFVGSVLVAVDIIPYAHEEHPREAKSPICLIAAAHTGGLSSISRVYTKLFVAGGPSNATPPAITDAMVWVLIVMPLAVSRTLKPLAFQKRDCVVTSPW